jgi:RNA polymerase sigma-70 factor (ECF subfamily)
MQGSDHSIVRAVLAGDKEAYSALVRAHSATVFRVAFRIAGNEADEEEHDPAAVDDLIPS